MPRSYINKSVRNDIYSNTYYRAPTEFITSTNLNTLEVNPSTGGVVFNGPTSIPVIEQYVELDSTNCLVVGPNGNLTPDLFVALVVGPDGLMQPMSQSNSENNDKSAENITIRAKTDVVKTFTLGNGVVVTIDKNGMKVNEPIVPLQNGQVEPLSGNKFYVVLTECYKVYVIHCNNWYKAPGNYYWIGSDGATGPEELTYSVDSFKFSDGVRPSVEIQQNNMFTYVNDCSAEYSNVITIPSAQQFFVKFSSTTLIHNNENADNLFNYGSMFLVNDNVTLYNNRIITYVKTVNGWLPLLFD